MVAPTTIVPINLFVAVAVATPFTAVAAPGKVAVPVPEFLLNVTWVVLSVVTVLPPASWIVPVSVRDPPPAVEPGSGDGHLGGRAGDDRVARRVVDGQDG